MHRTYDNKLKKCVSLVGSVCDSVFADELPRCIRNAECEDGRCICREGYTVTTKLTCMVGHGQECGPMQCNTDRGLACKSGICECLDKSYTYSAITRSCFDPEGFVKNVVETWFGRTFLRDMILRSAAKFFRKVISVLKSPKRLLRVFIGWKKYVRVFNLRIRICFHIILFLHQNGNIYLPLSKRLFDTYVLVELASFDAI